MLPDGFLCLVKLFADDTGASLDPEDVVRNLSSFNCGGRNPRSEMVTGRFRANGSQFARHMTQLGSDFQTRNWRLAILHRMLRDRRKASRVGTATGVGTKASPCIRVDDVRVCALHFRCSVESRFRFGQRGWRSSSWSVIFTRSVHIRSGCMARRQRSQLCSLRICSRRFIPGTCSSDQVGIWELSALPDLQMNSGGSWTSITQAISCLADIISWFRSYTSGVARLLMTNCFESCITGAFICIGLFLESLSTSVHRFIILFDIVIWRLWTETVIERLIRSKRSMLEQRWWRSHRNRQLPFGAGRWQFRSVRTQKLFANLGQKRDDENIYNIYWTKLQSRESNKKYRKLFTKITNYK